MRTNVSIKFSSIEEYREIEKKLIELGYKEHKLFGLKTKDCIEVKLNNDKTFTPLSLRYIKEVNLKQKGRTLICTSFFNYSSSLPSSLIHFNNG